MNPLKTVLLFLFAFSLNLFALTITEDTTLSENTTYNESVIVDGAVLNLDGHTLTINGDLNITGYYGVLKMVKSDDKLIVKGDVTFAGASTYGDLTKGVLELTGDFYQVGTRSYYNNYLDGSERHKDDNANSFYPTEQFKVIFNGTSTQTVSLAGARDSHFIDIDITNTAGVTFNQINILGSLNRNGNPINISHIENWTLEEDFTIPNDVEVYEVLNLNGHQLTVEGNFKTTTAYAKVVMTKSDDRLIVDGDVTFAGASTYGDLTKGVLELTGDFYQVGTRSYYNNYLDGSDRHKDNNANSFYPTEQFKVIFNGDAIQSVSFDSPENSRFMDIEIVNSREVEFTQTIKAVGALYTTPELYQSLYINSEKLIYETWLNNAYYYLAIKAGMNFIALPNTTELTLDDIQRIFPTAVTTIWSYDTATEAWSGYSKQEEKLSQMKEMKLTPLTSLKKAKGMVVNTLTDQTLVFPKGESYNIAELNIIENLSSGWHFLGTSRTVTVEKIRSLNANIVSIWSYHDGKYYATASDADFIQSIDKQGVEPLQEVEANRAFLVYVK